MRVLNNENLPLNMNTAVAVGLFDGVHKGHVALINDIISKKDYTSLVYTFDKKKKVACSLLTETEKQSVLESIGVEQYYSCRFTDDFANQTGEQFLDELCNKFGAKHITVGYDFKFGKNAAWDANFILQNAEKYGYSANVIQQVVLNDERVSSSAIRAAVDSADMKKAAENMGRFYFIDGRIEKGEGIGNTIGFPTANIRADKLLPTYGVYATVVKIKDKLYRSVTNVGIKPTVKEDDSVNIETFILDFEKDIYGKDIRVFFVEFIRPERTFENIEALKAQIDKDTSCAKAILNDLDVYKNNLMC